LGLKVGWRSRRLYIQTPRCRLLKKTSSALTARSWRNRNTLPIIQMVGANWVVFVPGSRLGHGCVAAAVLSNRNWSLNVS
jgi:hypothetical protein